MELTTEGLQRFVGGQMEIQNEGEGYLFRGEVATIVVESNEIRVRFAWLAKGEGYPSLLTWVNDSKLDYAANLEIFSANNIGPSGGDVGGGNRLCIQSSIVGEIVILYPPDGSKLDPARVQGLVLSPPTVS